MNLLIVETDELDSNKQLRLSGRRLKHLNEILKLQAGDKLRVGQLGGQIGVGLVRTIDTQVQLSGPTHNDRNGGRQRAVLLDDARNDRHEVVVDLLRRLGARAGTTEELVDRKLQPGYQRLAALGARSVVVEAWVWVV